MSFDNNCFKPAAAIPLQVAVMRTGEAVVAGWDAEAVEILRQVFASDPRRIASSPIITKRWPDKKALPKALADLIAAVAGSGEIGEILSTEEYMRRVDAAAARWPNDTNPARPQLDAVHTLMRQWIGGGVIKPFWYAADGSEVLIDARLARAKSRTAFEALMLYGLAPVDGGGPVWVREAELARVLTEHAGEQELLGTTAPPLTPAAQARKVSAEELAAAFAAFAEDYEREHGSRPGRDPTRAWGKATFGRRVKVGTFDELSRKDDLEHGHFAGRPRGA